MGWKSNMFIANVISAFIWNIQSQGGLTIWFKAETYQMKNKQQEILKLKLVY